MQKTYSFQIQNITKIHRILYSFIKQLNKFQKIATCRLLSNPKAIKVEVLTERQLENLYVRKSSNILLNNSWDKGEITMKLKNT